MRDVGLGRPLPQLCAAPLPHRSPQQLQPTLGAQIPWGITMETPLWVCLGVCGLRPANLLLDPEGGRAGVPIWPPICRGGGDRGIGISPCPVLHLGLLGRNEVLTWWPHGRQLDPEVPGVRGRH